MFLAPVQSMVWDTRVSESDGSMADWEAFVGGTRRDYGVDMGVLTAPYREEQRKYFLGVSIKGKRLKMPSIGRSSLSTSWG